MTHGLGCSGPEKSGPPTLPLLRAQVRFGVLNAGNFGVSQSRKRTFIWGAAPGEALPDWPRLMHVFRSPQLTIRLPGGVAYTAVPQVPGFAGTLMMSRITRMR